MWQAADSPLFHRRRKSYSRGDKRLWVSLAHTSPLILSPPAAVCHSGGGGAGTASGESGVVHTHPPTYLLSPPLTPLLPPHPDVSPSRALTIVAGEKIHSPSLSRGGCDLFSRAFIIIITQASRSCVQIEQMRTNYEEKCVEEGERKVPVIPMDQCR